MPEIDNGVILRIVWVSLAAATVSAIIATAVVHVAYVRAIRRIGSKGVVRVLTVLALAAIYVGSVLILVETIQIQLPHQTIGTQVFETLVFYDPGIFQRLIPVFAIVLTWLSLSIYRRRRAAA